MLVVASPWSDRLACWKEGLRAMDAILEVTDLDRLKHCLASYGPRLLFLDLDFPGLGGAAGIRKLRQLSPATPVVVIGQTTGDDQEIGLFAAGVRGCCGADADPDLLNQVATAVLQGEPWIRRSLVPRLLDELCARRQDEGLPAAANSSAVSLLTPREQQIAALVGRGESNKQIARRLDISERTVKAHLTDIFRKLGVCDRLNLALMVGRDFQV